MRRPGDLAHAPRLEVANRLHELGFGVHDEWPVARHRLAVRNAGQQQRSARPGGAEPHDLTGAENRQLTAPHLAPCDLDGAVERAHQGAVIRSDGDADVGTGIERPVLIDDRRDRIDHRANAEGLARDDHDARAAVGVCARGIPAACTSS